MAQTFLILSDNPKRSHVRELASRTVADLDLEGRWKVTISEPDKSRIQEGKYHAMIGDIAKQMVNYDGRMGDAESWKRLLVDQFKADTLADPTTDKRILEYWRKNPLTIVPSLDRQRLVTMGEQTRKFPISVATAFIEWLNAWSIDHDVRLSA